MESSYSDSDTPRLPQVRCLDKLDHQTALVIIDFAMKYLSRRYRESMSKWFGKAGNVMACMSCVLFTRLMTSLEKEPTSIS